MWYEILISNEFAHYFMNGASCDDSDDTVIQMLKGYSDIVNGVIFAWSICKKEFDNANKINIENLEANFNKSFQFCSSNLHLSKAKCLLDIWESIATQFNEARYCVDVDLLSAEQCAILIIYPFCSRMGGSFEMDFYKSGELKKYLCALKSKYDI